MRKVSLLVTGRSRQLVEARNSWTEMVFNSQVKKNGIVPCQIWALIFVNLFTDTVYHYSFESGIS